MNALMFFILYERRSQGNRCLLVQLKHSSVVANLQTHAPFLCGNIFFIWLYAALVYIRVNVLIT